MFGIFFIGVVYEKLCHLFIYQIRMKIYQMFNNMCIYRWSKFECNTNDSFWLVNKVYTLLGQASLYRQPHPTTCTTNPTCYDFIKPDLTDLCDQLKKLNTWCWVEVKLKSSNGVSSISSNPRLSNHLTYMINFTFSKCLNTCLFVLYSVPETWIPVNMHVLTTHPQFLDETNVVYCLSVCLSVSLSVCLLLLCQLMLH